MRWKTLGFYCVDNLPPELLLPLIDLERSNHAGQLAIAMDVRSANSLPLVPSNWRSSRARVCRSIPFFWMPAPTRWCAAFPKRGGAIPCPKPTRRITGHDQHRALAEAIELERELLADLRADAHVIDTSIIRPSQLQGYVKSFINAPDDQLTLVFESFAFKRGVPNDADFVFDVRMLPNPHYEPGLREL